MYKNKNIVITGAANGIGKALALFLLSKGANVFGIDLYAKLFEELETQASELTGHFTGIVGDVTKQMTLDDAAKHITKTAGNIHFWFNNAGISGLGAFDQQSESAFKKVIDVNLMGVINGTRAALGVMTADGFGSIINISSVAGMLPAPYMSAYNASKHGVIGFTRSLHLEHRIKKSPIKIVLVCPGFVETELINKGEKFGFPDWLAFMLSTKESVIREIDVGLRKGHEEIFPTFSGKMMKGLYRLFPKTTSKSSKVLLARSLKDAFFNKLDI